MPLTPCSVSAPDLSFAVPLVFSLFGFDDFPSFPGGSGKETEAGVGRPLAEVLYEERFLADDFDCVFDCPAGTAKASNIFLVF